MSFRKISAFLMLAFLLFQPASAEGEETIIVGILGQSNAMGRADCPNPLPPVPDGIYNFGNDYILHPAQEPIDSGVNQVDMVSYDPAPECSPALPLAIRLQYLTGKNIVLVPCAKGATEIIKWLPSTSRETLYGSCLNRVRTVNTNNSKIMIFFYQGESDSQNLADASLWGERFVQIVQALQTDFNDPAIVFVQVGRTTTPESFPYLEDVAIEQSFISLPKVSMIQSDSLVLQDTIHLDYFSVLDIGQHAANVLHYLSK